MNIIYLAILILSTCSISAMDTGATNIHTTAQANDLDALKNLLKKANRNTLNAQNDAGDTALHIACREGNAAMVLALVLKGASKNEQNKIQETPYSIILSLQPAKRDELLVAFSGPEAAAPQLTRARTLSVSSPNFDRTPKSDKPTKARISPEQSFADIAGFQKQLEYVRKIRAHEIARHILEPEYREIQSHNKNFNINARDGGHGNTALHHAADRRNYKAAVMLLLCGADPTIPNDDNKMPHECIAGAEYPENLSGESRETYLLLYFTAARRLTEGCVQRPIVEDNSAAIQRAFMEAQGLPAPVIPTLRLEALATAAENPDVIQRPQSARSNTPTGSPRSGHASPIAPTRRKRTGSSAANQLRELGRVSLTNVLHESTII